MPIFPTQQYQNLTPLQLYQLQLAINRVRFLKNKVSIKNNPILQAINTTRVLTDCSKNEQNHQFIVSMDRNLNRRPLTQLRQIRQKRNVELCQKQSVQQFKKIKHIWHVESQKNKMTQKAHKVFQCKSVKKAKQESKQKLKKIIQLKKQSIKRDKDWVLRQKMKKDEARVKSYQEKILIGAKIKQLIETRQKVKEKNSKTNGEKQE